MLVVSLAMAPTTWPSPQPPDGARIYAASCQACRQADGRGRGTEFPPHVGSEWVRGREDRLVLIILHGVTGEIEVEGETFNGLMPAWGPAVGDADEPTVATYVRGASGNKSAPVSVASIERTRAAFATRTTLWTVAELQRVLAR